MSTSIHVNGYQPADQEWEEYKLLYEQCQKLGIPIPKKVEDYFGGEPPGDRPGREIDINVAMYRWSDEWREGYQIDLSQLPPQVKFLRAYMSS